MTVRQLGRMTIDDVDVERLGRMPARELIECAFTNFGSRAAVGTSLQKTGVVVIDVASQLHVPFRVFFVDTLLNPKETYELLDEVERRYGIEIERYAPSDESLRWLHETFGQNAHFFDRQRCCRTRKTIPLQRALATVDVWLAGLRADQSEHRGQNTPKAEIVRTEAGRSVLKLNPLLDWTEQQVDEYAQDHALPRNKLYDVVSPHGERYQVIGCTPCHVPIKPHMPKRMSKFPWEQGPKECGIHSRGSGI
jgi:phosphoadenosine phosphosulfate reductase